MLDVGCGAGLAVSELSRLGLRAVGVDLSAEMAEEARQVSVDGVIGYFAGESFLRGLADIAVRVGAVSVAEGRSGWRIGSVRWRCRGSWLPGGVR
ncbi:bifunctional 2-polyprenyl-6-hydroxyphenol methylase/3-demethylubiquinol 3-O-methyltransferase UbiG [Amycolatopsis sp. TNS106]|uniref:class I SAM-dependent methyltransferase n=1 Tax=Amycolatopsis sp. TNS106 TaxID=2861750 RepID=UPI002103C330|nr:methyltransferase domain-containing protein [Amycolatopsis sp. TNS106]